MVRSDEALSTHRTSIPSASRQLFGPTFPVSMGMFSHGVHTPAKRWVTSFRNPIPRPAEGECHLDSEDRRAAVGRPIKSLSCPALHFTSKVVVTTAPSRQHTYPKHFCCISPPQVCDGGVDGTQSTARGPMTSTPCLRVHDDGPR